ncbi:MAG: acyclic terpene utilization AtuA family protein [Deltaproteobacteria bacterium]|nr:acyclic terpene utilization AtuA family protein [Deltaproteobacteria bacterium]
MHREFRVLSPTAILGYGFPKRSFEKGIQKKPHLIAVDAGSTDPGPYYLGSGKSFTSRASVKRDLDLMLSACHDASIPLIIGTAGGSGAKPHVDWTENIIREIARERGLSFRMAVIYADVGKDDALKAMDQGRIHPLFPAPEIGHDEINKSVRIVAQMGAEPVIEALKTGASIILCGRCYDPVPFAAPAIQEGYDPGLALHMGKILECAAIAASPGSGSDCVMGTLYEDHFVLESLNEQRVFTTMSTAAHTLYEKSDPYNLPGPGGTLDLRQARFESLEDGRTRVYGSRFVASHPYTVKLEGVKHVGYRTISICGIRDPMMIRRLDQILEVVKVRVQEDMGHRGQILFHKYGKNAVMGSMEPEKSRLSHEIGLVIEVISPRQKESDAVCACVRSTLLHDGYPDRMSTAGNLAFLYSPSDMSCGKVYEFNIYHLMAIDNPVSLFPVKICEVSP